MLHYSLTSRKQDKIHFVIIFCYIILIIKAGSITIKHSAKQLRLRYPHGQLIISKHPLRLQFEPARSGPWLFFFLCLLGLTGFLARFTPDLTSLSCSRSQGKCQLETRSYHPALMLFQDNQTSLVVPISTLGKAAIIKEQRWRSIRYFLAILSRQNRSAHPSLVLLSSAETRVKTDWANQINAFLTQTDQPELHLKHVDIAGIFLFDLPIYGGLFFLLWRGFKRLKGAPPNGWTLTLSPDHRALQGLHYSEFWGHPQRLNFPIEGAEVYLESFDDHVRLGLQGPHQTRFNWGDVFFRSEESLRHIHHLQAQLNAELLSLQQGDENEEHIRS